jgi:hypothetical protein
MRLSVIENEHWNARFRGVFWSVRLRNKIKAANTHPVAYHNEPTLPLQQFAALRLPQLQDCLLVSRNVDKHEQVLDD